MPPSGLWIVSALFGAIAVAVTAGYFALLGVLVGVFGVAQSLGGVDHFPLWLTGPAAIFAPVVMYVAAAMAAIPSGLVAAAFFHVASLGLYYSRLHLLVVVPIGALSGYMAAHIVLTAWWGWKITPFAHWLGAASGFLSALAVLFLPCLREIAAPIRARYANEKVSSSRAEG
jgi:hypothetical protein